MGHMPAEMARPLCQELRKARRLNKEFNLRGK